MKAFKICLILVVIVLTSCQNQKTEIKSDVVSIEDSKINWNNEIIYHVMQRSFYDSNGDLHGDLNGFVEKLDYLKELGVTTILFTPLYESDFYHNYFPINYEKIDPEYGTKEDYLKFVKAVHSRDLKFLMDMETQYAQSGNIWFDDSFQNPDSEYSDFIYYSDSLNQYPEQIFMKPNSPLKDFNLWPGKTRNIVLLDLNHPTIKDYMMDLYTYWVDPNGDGNFDDGVDGFRIDHIMDDLDYKGIFTNMYGDFWQPIFKACKDINPNIFVLGEQSNWNEYGEKMVYQSGADAAFSFPLRFAIAGEEGTHDMYIDPTSNGVVMEPNRIHDVVEESVTKFSDSTFTVNFLENHDTARWASVVNGNNNQLRSAAILNLLLPGVPSIYYGQELGLTGQTVEWGSDANHIPVREGFPWTSDYNDTGNALWYKDTGEWWDISIWQTEAIKDLSLDTQRQNKNSLWHHYKSLIELRTKKESLRLGDYQPIRKDNPQLLLFKRTLENQSVLVVLNLGDNEEVVETPELGLIASELMKFNSELNENSIKLGANGFFIAELNNQ
ncbi:MAG: alpha-amylase family glycosyl hydrolase [Bacteroidota bacterium]